MTDAKDDHDIIQRVAIIDWNGRALPVCRLIYGHGQWRSMCELSWRHKTTSFKNDAFNRIGEIWVTSWHPLMSRRCSTVICHDDKQTTHLKTPKIPLFRSPLPTCKNQKFLTTGIKLIWWIASLNAEIDVFGVERACDSLSKRCGFAAWGRHPAEKVPW